MFFFVFLSLSLRSCCQTQLKKSASKSARDQHTHKDLSKIRVKIRTKNPHKNSAHKSAKENPRKKNPHTKMRTDLRTREVSSRPLPTRDLTMTLGKDLNGHSSNGHSSNWKRFCPQPQTHTFDLHWLCTTLLLAGRAHTERNHVFSRPLNKNRSPTNWTC